MKKDKYRYIVWKIATMAKKSKNAKPKTENTRMNEMLLDKKNNNNYGYNCVYRIELVVAFLVIPGKGNTKVELRSFYSKEFHDGVRAHV